MIIENMIVYGHLKDEFKPWCFLISKRKWHYFRHDVIVDTTIKIPLMVSLFFNFFDGYLKDLRKITANKKTRSKTQFIRKLWTIQIFHVTSQDRKVEIKW